MRKLSLCLWLSLIASPVVGAQVPNPADSQQFVDELFEAAESGDLATVKSLLTEYPDMKTVTRPGGWTLLHLAFESREMVAYLIDLGLEIDARSGGLWTPLHNQAYGGHRDGVELLLDHGADLEAETAFGMTPLVSSIRWDRTEVARLLLERGANVDPVSELGRTPLIACAIEGNGDMVRMFLDYDADIGTRDSAYSRTALHFASIFGQLDIVSVLLEKGADINATDIANHTPLYYANQYGHQTVAELLKQAGAEGELEPTHFEFASHLSEELSDGTAYAWYMGENGCAVKTDNHLLLFNYSYHSGAGQPDEPKLANGRINLDEIADCRTTVFAGSMHHAHHHPEAFSRWQQTHEDIRFIYSFKDSLGRHPRYFNDVEGPEYVLVQAGESRSLDDLSVEGFRISGYGPPGTGYLVEADRLVIFHGGYHLLSGDEQRDEFRKPIADIAARGVEIDLLILPGNFAFGRVFSSNVEGIVYAVETLKPKAILLTGGDSAEFVLREPAAALEKYASQTAVFCPEHRGDMFVLRP